MSAAPEQRRRLGNTGLTVPPIVFCAAPLGNVGRVITDQAKLALCGEWFEHVASPVVIDVAIEHGDGKALEVLGRILKRLEISPEEITIQLSVADPSRCRASGKMHGDISVCWDFSRSLLDDAYHPKLICLENPSDSALRYARGLKALGAVLGVGVVAQDASSLAMRGDGGEFDCVTLRSGSSIMRHSPEIIAAMSELGRRDVPIIMSGVFEGGFLVGGNRLEGRLLNAEDGKDRSLLAWRKSFVALCDGHGVSPAHACIQFALALPGVVAVRLTSSYADRIAENVHSVRQKVPPNFWGSMKEEGLLSSDLPLSFE
jgi:D-threo-aldose 1-dehydrogenase